MTPMTPMTGLCGRKRLGSGSMVKRRLPYYGFLRAQCRPGLIHYDGRFLMYPK